jgi:phage-related tail fiber protein
MTPLRTKQAINAAADALVGAVMPFAFTTPPTGWFECDGSALSRTSYQALFDKIGITFGAGNGSTTFNIPDLRGEFLRSWDNGRGVDSGRGFGSWQKGSPYHHDDNAGANIYNPTGYDVGASAYGDAWVGDKPQQYYTPAYGSVQAPGVGGNFTSMARPRNVALMFCIKY